jgi:hypothetical protein
VCRLLSSAGRIRCIEVVEGRGGRRIGIVKSMQKGKRRSAGEGPSLFYLSVRGSMGVLAVQWAKNFLKLFLKKMDWTFLMFSPFVSLQTVYMSYLYYVLFNIQLIGDAFVQKKKEVFCYEKEVQSKSEKRTACHQSAIIRN